MEHPCNYAYVKIDFKCLQLHLNKSKYINVEVITIYMQVALECKTLIKKRSHLFTYEYVLSIYVESSR
jgi:hypothetical protein